MSRSMGRLRSRASAIWSRWWRRLLVGAGVAGLVALVRSLPPQDWAALVRQVGPALPVLVAVAVGWMAAYARGLSVIVDGAVGWGRLLHSRMVSEAYNVLTPLAGMGGEPMKVIDLASRMGTPRAVRAVVIDRVAYLTGGLVFSGLGTAVAVRALQVDDRIERLLIGYVVVALILAALLSLALTRSQTAAWADRLVRLFRLQGSLESGPVPIGRFGRAVAWNLAGRALGLIEITLLLVALGQQPRVDAVISIAGLLAVAGIVLFFVPSGLGVSEGAAVFAFALAGYGQEVGLAAGLARRARLLLTAAAGVALSAFSRSGPAGASAETSTSPAR